jgi:hypothetical protein
MATMDKETEGARLTPERVWKTIRVKSFAVVSYITPAGEPRSSGVVYAAEHGRLYVAVAPNSWKARHLAVNGRVAVTIPVRRGGVLSLVAPVPPATISFHGAATVHEPGTQQTQLLLERLGALLPPERRRTACVVEIRPEGEFVTYGVGVPLMKMRDPAAARGRVPVA